MTKFECTICDKSFDNSYKAYDHLIEDHGNILEAEYIMEVR